jgi:hypothetical protein
MSMNLNPHPFARVKSMQLNDTDHPALSNLFYLTAMLKPQKLFSHSL